MATPDPVGSGDRAAVSPGAVIDAALTLFAERGYHGTALSQVASVLAVRTPSLYNHMTSKQELLAAIIVSTTDTIWAEYQAATEGIEDVGERLWQAVYVYAYQHATHRREAIVVNRDVGSLAEPLRGEILQRRRSHERSIRRLLEEGVRQGRFIVTTPSIASFGILEMCVSIARWLRDEGPLAPDQVAAEYSDYALRIVGGRRPAG